MSLIHEALEKLESEKKARLRHSAPETLLKGTPLAPPVKESKTVIYAMAAVLIFFFFLGGIYLWLNPSREKPRPGEDPAFMISEPGENAGPTVKPAPAPFLFLNPESRFSLTGITQIGTGWNAIINNKLVKTGSEVDGAWVESIEKEKVSLRFQDQTVVLTLHADLAASRFNRLDVS